MTSTHMPCQSTASSGPKHQGRATFTAAPGRLPKEQGRTWRVRERALRVTVVNRDRGPSPEGGGTSEYPATGSPCRSRAPVPPWASRRKTRSTSSEPCRSSDRMSARRRKASRTRRGRRHLPGADPETEPARRLAAPIRISRRPKPPRDPGVALRRCLPAHGTRVEPVRTSRAFAPPKRAQPTPLIPGRDPTGLGWGARSRTAQHSSCRSSKTAVPRFARVVHDVARRQRVDRLERVRRRSGGLLKRPWVEPAEAELGQDALMSFTSPTALAARESH